MPTSALTSSAPTLLIAIQVAALNAPSATKRNQYHRLSEILIAGQSLREAIAETPNILPPTWTQLLHESASETDAAQVLETYLYIIEQQRDDDRLFIIKGLYPLLLCIGLITFIYCLLEIAYPPVKNIYSDLLIGITSQGAPALSVLETVYIYRYIIITIWLGCFLLTLLGLFSSKSFMNVLFILPPLQHIERIRSVAFLYRVMAMLLSARKSYPDIFYLAASLTPSRKIKRLLLDVHKRLINGESLYSQAQHLQSPEPELAALLHSLHRQLIHPDRSSQVLLQHSQVLCARYQIQLQNYLSLLYPIVLITTAIICVLTVYIFFSPMIKLLNALA